MAFNYKTINAKNCVNEDNSIYSYYAKVCNLRKEYDIISHGYITPILKDDENILAYIRKLGNQELLVVCNFFKEVAKINIDSKFLDGKVLISNYNDIKLNLSMT